MMPSPRTPPKTIGLIANLDKSRSRTLLSRAVQHLLGHSRRLLADPATARSVPGSVEACPWPELARQSDVILVFGGDGTMLRVAREVAGSPVPILGINTGHLGFLTAVTPAHLIGALDQILEGRFDREVRALLQAEIRGSSAKTPPTTGIASTSQPDPVQIALNDFVLSRGLASRLIELEVRVGDELLTRYRCDGLIVSSPTGSTAYSLAAGGAIVSPDAHVLILTPICPHTLTIRPLVLNLDRVIQVRLLSPRLVATLAADGQHQTDLQPGDTVVIQKHAHSSQWVQLEGNRFFRTLRQKLGWSGSNL